MKQFSISLVLFLCFFSAKAQIKIEPEKGFTPQIGVLVSMLNDMSKRVERTVKNLKVNEVDFLLDENANSIGTLIFHLAATEKLYQLLTFENREFNEEEKKVWGTRMSMGEAARKQFKGKEIDYYLDVYKKVRVKTLEYLKEKDDEWLAKVDKELSMNYHWAWYHVMEHQSSHLGQILLLKKRIP